MGGEGFQNGEQPNQEDAGVLQRASAAGIFSKHGILSLLLSRGHHPQSMTKLRQQGHRLPDLHNKIKV